MKKDFTIIIPVYNIKNEYILECINSLKNIDYNKEQYEVIFIDDGSTDDSKEYIAQLIEKEDEMVLYSQENQGVSCARNHGILRSEGKYILFIDPDDWIDPHILKELKQKIDSEPDLILFAHSEEYKNFSKNCYVNNQISKNTLSDQEKEELYRNLIDVTRKTNYKNHFSLFGSVWGKCYKKSVIKNNNLKFDKELKKAQDTAFNLQYINSSKSIMILDCILYHYRMVNTSITHKYNPKIIDIQSIFLKKIDEIIASNKTPQIEKAFSHRIFSSYLNILELFIFHSKNKNRYREKKREWKKLLNNEYFKQIKNLESSKYSFGIRTIINLTKNENFFLLSLLYKVKNLKTIYLDKKSLLYE